LPTAWPTGHAKGLRARGGFELSINWKDGELERATICALVDGPCKVAYCDMEAVLDMKAGAAITLDRALQVISERS